MLSNVWVSRVEKEKEVEEKKKKKNDEQELKWRMRVQSVVRLQQMLTVQQIQLKKTCELNQTHSIQSTKISSAHSVCALLSKYFWLQNFGLDYVVHWFAKYSAMQTF